MGSIKYSDIIRLLKVTDPKNLDEFLELRGDGIYVKSFDNIAGLTPEERALMTEHPSGNLLKPALSLPCTARQLHKLCVKYQLPLDEKAMKALNALDPAIKVSTMSNGPADEKLDPRLRASYLQIIKAMAVLLELELGTPHKAAARLAAMAAGKTGVTLPAEQTVAAKLREASEL